MSKRTISAALNGATKGGDSSPVLPGQPQEPVIRAHHAANRTLNSAQDKQKLLLSADTGHFSLVRALHLADFITLCNGMSSSKTYTWLDLWRH